MKERTTTAQLRNLSAKKKVAFGGMSVAVLAVGLSIALGKGEPNSPAANEALQSAPTDNPAATHVSTTATTVSIRDRQETGIQETGMSVLARAAADNKYLFVFFSKNEDGQTLAMKKVFDEATAKVADRALSVAVNVAEGAERDIVKKFELDRAPMPLVLAIAPNGAIMGGFPTQFAADDLLGVFGSPCTEQCMKSLQDGKLVLLCVQNRSTKSNAEALQGVHEFKADEKYAAATEVVTLDPANPAEASFLGDLKIDPQTTVAMTAFLAPPGMVISEVEGATTKDALVAALQQANTGCGPGGCGPGGCGPKK